MSETILQVTPGPASGDPGPAAGWDHLERELSAALRVLGDEVLVVSTRTGNRYVQFSVRPDFGLYAESVGNAYLEEGERLDDGQLAALAALGWSPPSRTPEEEPGRGPRGSPNFHREFPNPVPCDAVAALAVRTLVEVLRVPGPGALEYTAFDRSGRAVYLPALGLVRAPPPPARPSPARAERPHVAFGHLRHRVLAAVRRLAGDETLELDADGDVRLPLGRRTAVVRPVERPLLVRIYTEVASDVAANGALLRRLHEINARLALVRLVLANGSVFAAIDFPAAPFHAAHLEAAGAVLERVAEEVAPELREAAGVPYPRAGAGAAPN